MNKIFIITSILAILIYIAGFFNLNLFPISLGLILLSLIYLRKRIELEDVNLSFLNARIKSLLISLCLASISVFITSGIDKEVNQYYFHLGTTILIVSIPLLNLPILISYFSVLEKYITEMKMGEVSFQTKLDYEEFEEE